MPMVSYAQNREDVLLHRALAGQTQGFYIDVGANDPTVCSISKAFYEMGWHGINIEPARTVFQRLATERPRDINLNIGLSNRPQTLHFHECVNEPTLSTFSPALANWWKATPRGLIFQERRVPVLTLAQVCEQYVRQPIDFLSIDVELHEREVIEGHDWKRWRPRIVVVEDGISSETGRLSHEQWDPLLLHAEYLFAFFDGVNRFYVRQEDAHLLPLLQVPANSNDQFIPCERLVPAQLAHCRCEQLGPMSLQVAYQLRSWAQRYPRMSSVAKRLVRLLLTREPRSLAS